jgi:hypothetical protein
MMNLNTAFSIVVVEFMRRRFKGDIETNKNIIKLTNSKGNTVWVKLNPDKINGNIDINIINQTRSVLQRVYIPNYSDTDKNVIAYVEKLFAETIEKLKLQPHEYA